MYEDFLHFIWQFQYFEKQDLKSTTQDDIQVLDKGFLNHDAGADFLHARILINDMEWIGNIEIHLKSSHWNQHKHQHNPQYNNVILHVVWEDDYPIQRTDQSYIPTIELSQRVDIQWLYKYQSILKQKSTIACGNQFHKVRQITKIMMFDKALMQRLEQKAFLFKSLWIKNKEDWEETSYQLLAKNFGFKVNGEPFLRLSQSLPSKYLSKHRDNALQVEALLFGQAGFLDKTLDDSYHQLLVREYEFLSIKYQLSSFKLDAPQWNFLRLRPANFPELRIAQFAAMYIKVPHFFSLCLDGSFEQLRKDLKVEPSEYWRKHYRFGKPSTKKIQWLGEKSIESILINTVVITLVAYSLEKGQQKYMDKALQILESLKAEDNKLLRAWQKLGVQAKSSYDSQALIALNQQYCDSKKCLHCGIGLEIMQKTPE